ncbi:hypothetical protein LINPERHAP2_LOCUS3305 [Linum perenne]
MILKTNFAKAYDRVECSFLKDTHVFAGFPTELIDLTMAWVTTTSF